MDFKIKLAVLVIVLIFSTHIAIQKTEFWYTVPVSIIIIYGLIEFSLGMKNKQKLREIFHKKHKEVMKNEDAKEMIRNYAKDEKRKWVIEEPDFDKAIEESRPCGSENRPFFIKNYRIIKDSEYQGELFFAVDQTNGEIHTRPSSKLLTENSINEWLNSIAGRPKYVIRETVPQKEEVEREISEINNKEENKEGENK